MELSSTHFLVVDDDAFLRQATGNMLKAMNVASIREAGDGAQALALVQDDRAQPVHVILCDLNMPGMDGMEFIRHLGETQSTAYVIVMSAHDENLIASVKKMAIAYGVKLLGAVQKPVSSQQIVDLVEKFIPPAPHVVKKASTSPPLAFTLEEILHGIDEGQFEPFYQPKICFKSGNIKGMEALARWIHPTHGVISPYAFIQTLESSGNIDGLTFLILKKAAQACKRMHDEGHFISVSVNLSLNSLGDPLLAEKLTLAVREMELDPKYIVLEITESAAMTEVAQSLENLARLRMRGFGLSIDDYGTGFSNIQQMTRIAFSELKIDQSFVKNCTENKELCVVIRSSIEMSHNLNIECTAEGVETKDDWNTLKNLTCDTAQGYFIARPMNLSAFSDYCHSYTPLFFL